MKSHSSPPQPSPSPKPYHGATNKIVRNLTRLQPKRKGPGRMTAVILTVRRFLPLFVLLAVASAFFFYIMYIRATERVEVLMPQAPSSGYRDVSAMLCDPAGPVNHRAKSFVIRQSPVISGGSLQTQEYLNSGVVQLGLMQYNALCENVRNECNVGILGTAYEEVMLFFLSRRHEGKSLNETALALQKEGRTLKIGCLSPEYSQTCQDLRALLRHMDLDDAEIVSCDYDQARSKLLDGQLDGAFFVGSIAQKTIRAVAEESNATLLSIDLRDGFIKSRKGLIPYDIPAGTFGKNQPHAVSTVATRCVIVASLDVPSSVISEVLKRLVEERKELTSKVPFFDFKRPGASMRDLLHPGTRAYLSQGVVSDSSFKTVSMCIAAISAATSVISAIMSVIAFSWGVRTKAQGKGKSKIPASSKKVPKSNGSDAGKQNNSSRNQVSPRRRTRS